jgi:pyruvate formate lyase activating enzyme
VSATGLIFGVERFALHDGPGIRTTVFFKGCPLRCWWCHSPESQSPRPEPSIKADRCIQCGRCLDACPNAAIVETDGGFDTLRARCTACGTCTDLCPSGAREIVGRRVTAEELAADLEKDTVFFDRSGGGVTFSGGEPLMQPAFLAELLARCRARGIHTAVETCGFASWRAMKVAAHADLVLFDLKILDDARHRAYTGVSNRPILANFGRFTARCPAVRVRLPLVPGVNDDPENVTAIGALVRAAGLAEIDLLPYHTAGLAKYNRIGRPSRLPDVKPPTSEALVRARLSLERLGVSVHVGG